jgi:hypothetical protein
MKRVLSFLAALLICGSASAQVPMTGAGLAKPATAGGGITFTPTDAQSNAPGFAGHNYTINIGTASTDRIVVVGWQLNATGAIAAPTINGSGMTYAIGSGATNSYLLSKRNDRNDSHTRNAGRIVC